ncbi:hypothetical protein MUP35_04570 [Patescibacteria group bacterium]|nr:hypothetical protein [Patescibacteria group bacterium]
MNYEASSEQPSQATEEGTSEGCRAEPKPGEIALEEEETKQPDFSIMNNRLELTRPKLMPLSLNEKVEIATESIETRAKHFIVPAGESACAVSSDLSQTQLAEVQEESIPETQFILPDWWTKLLGQTKIFCGLFSASERCLPPENLNIKIEKPPLDKISEEINLSKDLLCDKSGEKVKDIKPKELISLQEKFGFSPKFLAQIFSKLVEGTKKFFEKTEETAQLENRTRGVLVGGHTLANQSEFFSNFIPHEINSSMDDGPIAGNAAYTVDEGFTITEPEFAEKENYQEQDQVRIRNCLQLCALYPPKAGFNISDIDPICESCNPEDYKAE